MLNQMTAFQQLQEGAGVDERPKHKGNMSTHRLKHVYNGIPLSCFAII